MLYSINGFLRTLVRKVNTDSLRRVLQREATGGMLDSDAQRTILSEISAGRFPSQSKLLLGKMDWYIYQDVLAAEVYEGVSRIQSEAQTDWVQEIIVAMLYLHTGVEQVGALYQDAALLLAVRSRRLKVSERVWIVAFLVQLADMEFDVSVEGVSFDESLLCAIPLAFDVSAWYAEHVRQSGVPNIGERTDLRTWLCENRRTAKALAQKYREIGERFSDWGYGLP